MRSAGGPATPPIFRLDRWSALGLGVLIGLTTVLADRARAMAGKARRPPSAASPADVSARGWREIAKRVVSEFNEDRIPAVAAGSAFFALLALFPALGLFVSLFGLVGDLPEAQRQIAGFSGILPAGGVTVLTEQIERLAAVPDASLGLTFVFSLLVSVWSSNAGMKALIAGLNVAYEVRERRNFLELNLVSLAFTAGGIVFALLAMAAIVAAPQALTWLGLEDLSGLSLLRWPAMLLVAAGGLSLLYRFAPSRRGARWRWITPGGAAAAVVWMVMSAGFSLYVGYFGTYDRTYGSLGAVVGFMTWIWLSLIVVLTGAEFNAELEAEATGEG